MDNIKPTKCYSYNYKLADLLIIPSETFSYLCTNYDKTYLFLTTFARSFIYLLITKLFYDYFLAHTKSIFVDLTFGVIFVILLGVCFVNLCLLLYVMVKNFANYSNGNGNGYQGNMSYMTPIVYNPLAGDTNQLYSGTYDDIYPE